jgi:hypothetical protein
MDSYNKYNDNSLKKIECNNINVNNNGFNGATLPTSLNGLASDEAQASADGGEIGASSFASDSGSDAGRPSGSDRDLRVVCIYNNDNIVIGGEEPTPLQNIKVEIKARVTSVDDFTNVLNGAVKEGDIITGKYVYDSLSKDTNDDPTVGDYEHKTNPYGIFLKAGKLVFQTDPKNVDFLLEYVNRDDSDNFVIHSYNNLPLKNKLLVDHISWQLDDPTTQAISSDSLKDNLKAPDLSKWQQPFGLTIEGHSTDQEEDGFFIRGEVFSAKAVSEGENE